MLIKSTLVLELKIRNNVEGLGAEADIHTLYIYIYVCVCVYVLYIYKRILYI